jgi:hypothetical protein
MKWMRKNEKERKKERKIWEKEKILVCVKIKNKVNSLVL